MTRREFFAATASLALAGCSTTSKPSAGRADLSTNPAPTRGPLRVHPRNRRYFADNTGRLVYLSGAHTWPNLVDQGLTDPPPIFDFGSYLDVLTRHRHNFIRLWTWESTVCDIDEGGRRMRYFADPQPWLRTGPGLARDGKPKFDLARWNPAYFQRLRDRTRAAGARGIYVSIMLFEGWAMQHARGAYEGHPFHPDNNINGVRGDLDGDGRGLEIHTLTNPATLARQQDYVRHIIETVTDLDNVLYEISNENHPASTEWQYHLIRWIRAEEQRRGRVHPIGMTFQYKGGSNATLFNSPADWISPNPEGGYRDDPPPADGRKVILNDTDHLWGIGGSADWVWRSFLRGHNPLFMDPYDGVTFGAGDPGRWEPIRRALGQTCFWAERIDLAAMAPRPELASSGYCLANTEGESPELLVYVPGPGVVSIDLTTVPWAMEGTAYDLAEEKLIPMPPVPPGVTMKQLPLAAGPYLIHLRREQRKAE